MLTDLEFPMYFSLAPNPGYNNSFLDSLGIGGEFDLFLGNHSVNNGTGVIWKWGSVNHSIEGMLDSLGTINYIFLKMFGLRAD